MVTLLGLSLLALGLTVAMFATRNMLLGFPSAIFWGILGGYSYQQSSTTWDWQYTLFFSAMGMVIFCMFAAYTLRRGDLAGPDLDKEPFIDEGGSRKRKLLPRSKSQVKETDQGEPERDWGDIDRLGMHDLEDIPPERHARTSLHERAKRRKAKASWGEFK